MGLWNLKRRWTLCAACNWLVSRRCSNLIVFRSLSLHCHCRSLSSVLNVSLQQKQCHFCSSQPHQQLLLIFLWANVVRTMVQYWQWLINEPLCVCVYVFSVPGQPTNLQGVSSSASEIQLTWDAPEDAGDNIQSYELYYNDSYHRRSMHMTISPPRNSYLLTDLTPNTVYHLRVSAKSQRGEGAPTAILQVRTIEHGKGCWYFVEFFVQIFVCCTSDSGASFKYSLTISYDNRTWSRDSCQSYHL